MNSLLYNVIYETKSRNGDFKDPTIVQDRHTLYTKHLVWRKTWSECLKKCWRNMIRLLVNCLLNMLRQSNWEAKN